MILSTELDKSLEGKTVIATGLVVSLPEALDISTRFEFQIETMQTPDGKFWPSPGKVRISWYGENVAVNPGERWQLHLRLKRPYGFSNPGGFDYEAWLFQKRVRATGYVRSSSDNRLLNPPSRFAVDYWRQILQSMINDLDLPALPKGLLLALSLGDRSGISAAQWQTLISTGTSHLIAISGLHVGLVAGLCFLLGRWLWACTGMLPLYLAAPRFGYVAGFLGALIYAALAGFAIPTQRALIMLSVLMGSLFFYRGYEFSRIIALALLFVLIFDPFAVLSIGFWLSFVAVCIIAFGLSHRVAIDQPWWLRGWWKWGRVQFLVAVGLLPLLALYFQQYPLLGLFANMVAVPYIGLIVVPLILAGVILLPLVHSVGEFVLLSAGQTLALLWPFLQLVADFKAGLWRLSSPSPLAFVLAVIGTLIILSPKGLLVRWIGLVWLLPLLFPQAKQLQPGEFEFTQLDVGQGLSSVIRTRNHVLVYDAGAKFGERFNAGQIVTNPFLRQQNLSRIDMLVISHGDNDHIGGAAAVLRQFPDALVLTSVPDKIKYPMIKAEVKACYEGKAWQWDGVYFEILNPINSENYRGNNHSCVLKVSSGPHAVLLSGDIEHAAERRLVGKYGKKLAATVLVAPHHGSATSSTIPFIDMVDPEYVIFSTGYRNRFGFPQQNIISRYADRQIIIFNTAQAGAVLFDFKRTGVSFSQHRQQAWRFWRTEF